MEPIYASNESGVEFEKAPIGMQQAICAYVFDIGNQKTTFPDNPVVHKIIIVWELAENFTEGKFVGKPFMMSKYYTLSLGEKANLRKDLESWRGQPFTQEELKRFDVTKLVGANCYLNITPTESNKRKISAITPLPKGIERIAVTDIEPSENVMKWIDRERAKSVEMIQEPAQHIVGESEPKDDLPF